MALIRDRSLRGHCHGTSACLSALYRAERYDELVDILRVDTIWTYQEWAVRALAAKGQRAEALRYAESCRSGWGITSTDVCGAYRATLAAAGRLGRDAEVKERLRKLVAGQGTGDRLVTQVLGWELGLR